MLVVAIVYMKVLWNLQEGLQEASEVAFPWRFGISPRCFFNGRTTEKNSALPIDNLGFTHPTVQAAPLPQL